MEIVGHIPHGKNRFCLVKIGNPPIGHYIVEYWVKTRRRRDPYDRYSIAGIKNSRISKIKSYNVQIKIWQDHMKPFKKQLKDLCVVEEVISS